MQQNKFPEDGFVLGIVLMLDLINSLARYSIFLGITPTEDPATTCDIYSNSTSLQIVNNALQIYRNETEGVGRDGIIVFSILFLPLIVVFIVLIVLYILSARQKPKNDGQVHHSPLLTLFFCGKSDDVNFADHSPMSYITGLIQCLLVTVYFFADNLGPLVQSNGDDFGCTGSCASNVQLVSSVLSVGSILLLHNIPYLLHHWVQASVNKDYVIENEKTLLGVLGNIVKVDAAFTALTVYTDIANNCSTGEHALNWIVLIACTVGGGVYISIKIINAKKDPKTGPVAILFTLVLLFIMVLLFLYLASDNGSPLDCSFHCDANGPSGDELSHPLLDRHCCNIHVNVVTRLVFTVIAIVMTTIVAAIIGVIIFRAGKSNKNQAKSGEEAKEKSAKDETGKAKTGKDETSKDVTAAEKKSTEASIELEKI